MNAKYNIAHRLLAALLSLVLVFGMLPEIAIPVSAISEEVTIQVQNEDGEPLVGAKVQYTVSYTPDEETGEVSVTGNASTIDGGMASIAVSEYYPHAFRISGTVTMEGYESASFQASDPASDALIGVTLKKIPPVIEDVTITPADSWTYNGSEKPLVAISGTQAGDVVTYLLNSLPADGVPTAKDAGTYSVTVTVVREGHKDLVENFTVKVDKADIEGVTLTPADLTYSEEEHTLAAVTGTEADDKVTWTVDGVETAVPTATNAGTYAVTVTVDRGGNFNPLTLETTVEIEPADIVLGGLAVKGLNGEYNGEAQKAVTVENAAGDYTLHYQLTTELQDGKPVEKDDAWTTEIPTVTDAGSYVVLVKAVQENYNDTDVPVEAAAGAVTPFNVYVAPKKVAKPEADTTEFVYDGSAQTYTLTVPEGCTVAGNVQTNAGDYKVTVALVSGNYAWSDGTTGIAEYDFKINQAPQSIKFANPEYENGKGLVVEVSGAATFNFNAAIQTASPEENRIVTYTISRGGDPIDAGIAQIDNTGLLSVVDAGEIQVVAGLASDDGNYETVSATFTLFVTQTHSEENPLIDFEKSFVDYVLGHNDGVPENPISRKFDDDNAPAYSLSNSDQGLSIDPATGIITVTDYDKVAEAMNEAGTDLELTVTATKEAKLDEGGRVLYGEATASYVVKVSFADAESGYTMEGDKGAIDGVETGWYLSEVTLTPEDPENYQISTSANPDSFGESVTISQQGKNDFVVYLRSNSDGTISSGSVTVQIDTGVEDPEIKYSTDIRDLTLEMLSLGFIVPKLIVTVKAEDTVSGIDHFDYEYKVDEGVSSINKGGEGVLGEDDITENTATFTIDKSFHGRVSVTVTDKAGNTATTADDAVIIVDPIAPGITVSYFEEGTENSIMMENDACYPYGIDAVIKIEEANFDAADWNNLLFITKTVDGVKEDLGTLKFTSDGDFHTARISFLTDADYTLTINYTDRAGNLADEYAANFTVDLTAPVIEVLVTNGDVRNEKYFKAEREAQITVNEHNFIETGFVATVNGEKKELEWDSEGDIHKATIPFPGDAHYTLKISQTDKAGNINKDVNYGDSVAYKEFVVDKTAPAGLKIKYSDENEVSVWDDLLEALSLGFYKTPITVTLTAVDPVAGIESFQYTYTVEDGVSNINTGGSGSISDKLESGEDGVYTGTFEIPAQFRGIVSFTATDKAGNTSAMTDTYRGVVVDNKDPSVGVDYGDATFTTASDGKTYSQEAVKATITIEEANFFGAKDMEDVNPETGKPYLVITVVETLNDGTVNTYDSYDDFGFASSGDVHTITVPFNNDADYEFAVSYTDRSGNPGIEFSDSFTVDTINPVITAALSNDKLEGNESYFEGHEEYLLDKFFKEDRTVSITVKEHNFNPEDVIISITRADDENGKNEETITPSISWDCEEGTPCKDDEHIVQFTLEEDGYYTLELSCTDLAGRKDMEADYGESVYPTAFVIDKTAPDPGAIELKDEQEKIVRPNEFGTIEFNTFYKEGTTFYLNANCDVSGERVIRYQKVYTATDTGYRPSADKWVTYVPDDGISAAPNERFVIFFQVEDNAGNITQGNSVGIVMDDKAPEFIDEAPEVKIRLEDLPEGKSIYTDDVTVSVQVIDPKYQGDSASDNGTFSGLKTITYIIADEPLKPEDTEIPAGAMVVENVLLNEDIGTDKGTPDSDGLISTWSGGFEIDAQTFDSNTVYVKVIAVDNAGNSYSPVIGPIKIDVTAPAINVSYDNNNPENGFYYNANRTATITITDRNFNPEKVEINITNSDGTLPNLPTKWDPITTKDNKKGEVSYRATITYSADGDYTFDIACTDEAGWTCGINSETKKYDRDVNFGNNNNPTEFTIDKTAPVVKVTYDNNKAENGIYFDATRIATVTITEHNFDPTRVVFTQTAERGGVIPEAEWTHAGNVHTATFNYTVDGDYTFDVSVTDLAGNNSGDADYSEAVAGQSFIIDTAKDMITIGGVENGKAYGYDADVIPTVSIFDINLEDYSVSLVGVQKDSVIDLTEKVNALLQADAENVNGTFDIFEVIQSMDGIYTLSVTAQDKAGNQDEETVVFTVNRFGSVYVYSDYLLSLIANGGAYVKSVTEDLIITEYNADKLVPESLIIEITCDGRPLENVIFTVTPEINDAVAVGESGWYQYKYTISKDNFTSDGVYKISISSKDATGNAPENNSYEDMGITFYVDATLPEITSIVGLEEPIINATEQIVRYTVYDTMGLRTIQIFVDGNLVDEIADFSADRNNYSGSFTLTERNTAQTVRIVVEDLAGNITDTDSEGFSSAYLFNKAVTVSTNIFVRWYANKPLFWGSIGGIGILAIALCVFLAAKRKKAAANV